MKTCQTLNLFAFCLLIAWSYGASLNANRKLDISPDFAKRLSQGVPEDKITLKKDGVLQKNLQNASKFVNDVQPRLEERVSDCWDLLQMGQNKSGIYTLNPPGLSWTISVYCDMETDGGGWTVFQRRDATFKPRNSFTNIWGFYIEGFGLLDQEFWLGFNNILSITSSKNYSLRVDLGNFEGEKRYAKYSTFSILDELDYYQLSIGGYSGDAGDSMSDSNGKMFSTIDYDADLIPDYNCAYDRLGAWWYSAGCSKANLNGFPEEGVSVPTNRYMGIYWFDWLGYHYSLKFTEMKLRPASVK